jgi:hypothetical protein
MAQDDRDILCALDVCDGRSTALCIGGPTGYSLGVTRMTNSDPIPTEGLGLTGHVRKVGGLERKRGRQQAQQDSYSFRFFISWLE